MPTTVVMIMAGGKGSRLAPLTVHRAKPAMPFGGRYRIIDFVLSNFVNSGYRHIYVLTQYMASSLIKHLNRNWRIAGISGFIEVVPAQMRTGAYWYRGTADSVFQNLNLIRDARADNVAVFGGDHIYKFAVDQMEDQHERTNADLTVAAFPVPRSEASRFGVIEVDDQGAIVAFHEKPSDPAPIPGDPDRSLVSMGNYIFKARVLEDALVKDAGDPRSGHDFGRDIIPYLVRKGKRVFTYDFGKNTIPGEPDGAEPYWRDVGTIDSLIEANMDLRSPLPRLNLYNRQWRIRTAQRDYPPARFVQHGGSGVVDQIDSLVCEGSIVQSAVLNRVILGYDCFVHAGARLEDCVLLSGCDVGEGAFVRKVFMDKNCMIEAGAVIGYDENADRARFPFVSELGWVVLPKGTFVPRDGPVAVATDIRELLESDPDTADVVAAFGDRLGVRGRNRHSFMSAGPRYRGPGIETDESEDD